MHGSTREGIAVCIRKERRDGTCGVHLSFDLDGVDPNMPQALERPFLVVLTCVSLIDSESVAASKKFSVWSCGTQPDPRHLQ